MEATADEEKGGGEEIGRVHYAQENEVGEGEAGAAAWCDAYPHLPQYIPGLERLGAVESETVGEQQEDGT